MLKPTFTAAATRVFSSLITFAREFRWSSFLTTLLIGGLLAASPAHAAGIPGLDKFVTFLCEVAVQFRDIMLVLAVLAILFACIVQMFGQSRGWFAEAIGIVVPIAIGVGVVASVAAIAGMSPKCSM